MIWSSLQKSHHCPESTLSVLSFFNSSVESLHLLAIGSDIGTVDVVNLENRSSVSAFSNLHDFNVIDVGFVNKEHLLSFDKRTLVYLDIITQNRSVIYDKEDSVQCLSYWTQNVGNSPIIASTKSSILSFDLHVSDPSVLIQEESMTDLCLLPDCTTLFGIKNSNLYVTDVRNPVKFYDANVNMKFEKLSCNQNYLTAISKADALSLYSFELPFNPALYDILLTFENPFINKPSFHGDYILVGNADGMINIVDPVTKNFEMIPGELETPIVSIVSTESEIALSYEDDIYVYSYFEWEDNIIKAVNDGYEDFGMFPNLNENGDPVYEEDEQEPWLTQVNGIELEEGECTYERYGYCEQQIFSCLTCCKNRERPIGICEQCANICHDGHNVIPIGTRRNFRCDCGNNRCREPCKTMFQAKVSENTCNHYNHNFFNKWCVCDGPDQRPMVQCICCDDWFHHECIGFFSEKRCLILDETPCLADYVFVCNDCISNRLTFIDQFPDAVPPEEIKDFVYEMQEDSGIKPGEDGDPKLEGVGFRILGGRWIPKDQFNGFKGRYAEYDASFDKIDASVADAGLQLSKLQQDYSNFMKKTYTDLFESVLSEGRTVIQKSDTDQAISKNIMQLYIQRMREHDPDDDGGNAV